LIGLLAWMLRPGPPPRTMATRQLTLSGNASNPSLSPDSKWGAYLSADSILVQDLSTSQPILAARAGVACDAPKWSPDGAMLLFTTSDSTGRAWLATVPRLGGPVSRLAHVGCGAFGYSPDGRRILASPHLQDSVFILDLASGEVLRRFSVAPTSFTAWRAVFSPDGHWIAFGGERDGIPYLALVSPDGSTIRRLVDWVDRGTLQWSPHGDALYFFQRVPGGADLMKVRIDPETGERRGDPVRVISHAAFTEFSVGADGHTLLYQKDSRIRQIWTFSIAGPAGRTTVTPRQLTRGTANYGSPVISPDGRQVLYAQDDAAQRSLYVVPFEGGETPRLIGATRSDWMTPKWAPDSRRIAFTPVDSTTGGIMIADLSGGRPERHGASRLGHYRSTIGWSHDGGKLLYPSDDPRKFMQLDLDKNEEVAVSPPVPVGWLRAPVFAPDGRELVIGGVDHDRREALYRVTLGTGNWQRLGGASEVGTPLLWSADGWIYFEHGREIRRLKSDGTSTVYATLPRDCFGPSGISLDESALHAVCNSGENSTDIWVATDFDPEVRP
jgi:Tol biopolymer transport system component